MIHPNPTPFFCLSHLSRCMASSMIDPIYQRKTQKNAAPNIQITLTSFKNLSQHHLQKVRHKHSLYCILRVNLNNLNKIIGKKIIKYHKVDGHYFLCTLIVTTGLFWLSLIVTEDSLLTTTFLTSWLCVTVYVFFCRGFSGASIVSFLSSVRQAWMVAGSTDSVK